LGNFQGGEEKKKKKKGGNRSTRKKGRLGNRVRLRRKGRKNLLSQKEREEKAFHGGFSRRKGLKINY